MNRMMSVMFALLLFVGWAQGQESGRPSTSANPKLVYQLRKAGWATALEMLSKLEKVDKEKFPGVLAFSADVRRLDKSIDSTKAKHEWNLFETAPLLHRNPNFWRAMYEIAPSEPAFKFVHIGLLMTSGEIDEAHNLIHLLLHDAEIQQLDRDRLKWFDSLTHQMLSDSFRHLSQGIKLHDSKDFDAAIKIYEDVLTIWPQSSAAQYELGYSKRMSKKDPSKHFENCRHLDPLNLAAHQGEYSPEIALARQEVGEVIQLWKESLKSKSSANDKVLLKFAQGCQNAAPIEIRFHELALVARQIVVARKGQYDDQDREFIATSLQQLVPGRTTEETIHRLKDESLELFLVAPKK
jgi:hypothetical protein